MTSYRIGQKIQLNDGRVAQIRFLGTTAFQTGEWIGIELEEPTGKNDGSVKGDRYFQCEQGYGMFLRPSGIRSVLEDATRPLVKKPGTTTTSAQSRPSSLHAGVNGVKKADVTAGKRASMVAASPTPGSRASQLSGIRSPVKSPTKQLGSNGVSSSATSRTSTPSTATSAAAARRIGTNTATTKTRQSMAGSTDQNARAARPPATAAAHLSRPSVASSGRSNGTVPNAKAAARPPATQTTRATTTTTSDTGENERSTMARAQSTSEEDGAREEADDPGPLNFAPPPPPPNPPETASRVRRGSSPAASVVSQRTARSTAISSRHVEELEAKVRLLERKRLEDRDIKKSLEQAQQERDKYQGIIEKLQKKYQPQQQEIADLKKALSRAESKHTSVEDLQAEHESMLEMATLDKEMAEETADALRHELDALRARQEEMEMELDLLRDENAEFSKDMSPEERTSAGWLQLEKENDRLRNALLRLRDLTQDREQELKGDLNELRAQVEAFEKVRTQFDAMREKLSKSESTIANLREQLEAATDAENMIEELTDRNMGLNERIGELRITIEDLENIKELNDELEINHVEAEKQLQEEIDFKDALLLDRDRAAKLQQGSLDDADYTITKFRELVVQLQSDLQDMQASKQISDTEASELSNKSRAMMDLNIRLQNSAAKTQVKTIELEFRKMDAEEAAEHLAIVQLFLPDSFHTERDSVLALLTFKRIRFKANLLQTFIRERVSAYGTHSYDSAIFAGVDVLNALTWIASMADRFVNSICSCSIADFTRYETALYEIEPVERTLNAHLDALRREEVKEPNMAEDLLRSIGVMVHLATIHISDSLSCNADEFTAKLQVLHSELEGIALAFGAINTLITSALPQPAADGDDVDNNEDEEIAELQLIIRRSETLINHARSAKVLIGKADRALKDLQERSLTFDPTSREIFDKADTAAQEVVAYCRKAGDAVQELITNEGRLGAISAADIISILSDQAVLVFRLPSSEAGPFTTVAQELRALSDHLTLLAALPNDLDNCVEFERLAAPWVARADQIRKQKLNDENIEGELARTLDLLREREVAVKNKDAELDEQNVRIETLEARMRDASKRSARIAELETQVQKATEAERRAKRELDRSKSDAQAELIRVRDELGRATEQKKYHGSAAARSDSVGPGAQLMMKRQDQKITTLQSAVRFLQEENTRLRMPTISAPLQMSKTAAWLYEPLVKPKSDVQIKKTEFQLEGRRLLHDLLHLATTTPSVDLTTLPQNKLAWRPAKASSRWQIEKRRERWETWRNGVDTFVSSVPPVMTLKTASPFDEPAEAHFMHSAVPRTIAETRMSRPMSIDIKVPGSLPMH